MQNNNLKHLSTRQPTSGQAILTKQGSRRFLRN
jgi:hypothetical protein